jgi:Raf kinase inhibitor-like YbhB/YbcL family protein
MSTKKLSAILILLVFLAACSPQVTQTPDPFTLTSERFDAGKPIPEKYTCKGQNVSPSLAWFNDPEGVKSFALIMRDPDAPGGNWIHWVLYNIPVETNSLPDVLPGQGGIAFGADHGMNTAGNTYYEGPCPPSGTHRYFFTLYALDTILDFPASPDAAALTAAMQGHILVQAELMGTYTK